MRAWKHRNYFPRVAWPEILGAFPDIDLDTLKATERKSPDKMIPAEARP